MVDGRWLAGYGMCKRRGEGSGSKSRRGVCMGWMVLQYRGFSAGLSWLCGRVENYEVDNIKLGLKNVY